MFLKHLLNGLTFQTVVWSNLLSILQVRKYHVSVLKSKQVQFARDFALHVPRAERKIYPGGEFKSGANYEMGLLPPTYVATIE